MQTEEQRQKLDEVTRLISEFCDLALNLALKYKVASPAQQEPDGGAFQVARHKGTWTLIFIEDGQEVKLALCSIAVKRRFLLVADRFFNRYLGMARQWEKSIDEDIEKGRQALDQVRKLIA